jgi:hypothetical protein
MLARELFSQAAKCLFQFQPASGGQADPTDKKATLIEIGTQTSERGKWLQLWHQREAFASDRQTMSADLSATLKMCISKALATSQAARSDSFPPEKSSVLFQIDLCELLILRVSERNELIRQIFKQTALTYDHMALLSSGGDARAAAIQACCACRSKLHACCWSDFHRQRKLIATQDPTGEIMEMKQSGAISQRERLNHLKRLCLYTRRKGRKLA